MRPIDIVRAVAPLARENYLAALEVGDALLSRHEINTPDRLAHFLAQILQESGGFRHEWENMNYRAERLVEVFGVGKHSAAITPTEAQRLAHRPEAIAERVYGLGNTQKAAELGNVHAGDAFRYRGGGLMQTTGRSNYRRMGQLCGVDFEARPELIVTADHALKPAVAEWSESRLNGFADADDLLSISRAINIGNANTQRTPNGLTDRREWLERVRAAMREHGEVLRIDAPGALPLLGRNVTMDLNEVQRRLKAMGLYLVEVDGIYGRTTEEAVKALLLNQHVADVEGWPELRLVLAAQQVLCRMDGIEVGKIDGLLGPQTREAFQLYARRMASGGEPTSGDDWRDRADPAPEEAEPPIDGDVGQAGRPVSRWPREAGVAAYFGAPGSNQVRLQLPFPMKLAWDTDEVIRSTRCHRLVKEPLERIWARTLQHYGLEEVRRLRLDLFGGCLNVRRKRGGSDWSMHAYGIAWDVDPSRNALKMKRDEATLDAPDYDAFWGFVYDEGAVSLGRERDYDWMHFQFARL